MINIVLCQPEIPQNTGNIMRTCVAIGAKLHLIKPLGFSLDKTDVRRSAANYLEQLDYEIYDSMAEFIVKNKGDYCYLTRYAKQTYSEIDFTKMTNIYLVFGSESKGIAKEILSANVERCFRIPTTVEMRALNLSNAVAIVSYEVMRQLDFPNLMRYDQEKGADFLAF